MPRGWVVVVVVVVVVVLDAQNKLPEKSKNISSTEFDSCITYFLRQ